jgi:flagellar biosynthesis protein FlhB
MKLLGSMLLLIGLGSVAFAQDVAPVPEITCGARAAQEIARNVTDAAATASVIVVRRNHLARSFLNQRDVRWGAPEAILPSYPLTAI